MKRQLILGLSIVMAALLGGCGPTTEEKVQNLLQSASDWSDKGDYDQAIKDYSEAIKLESGDAAVWYKRGSAYSKKGDHDQAIKDCSEAIKLKSDYAAVWYHRGVAYSAIGEKDKAIAGYREAFRLDPDDPHYASAYHKEANILRLKE